MLNLSLLCEDTLNPDLDAAPLKGLNPRSQARSTPSSADLSALTQEERTGEERTGEEGPQLKALRWALFDERLSVSVERYPSGLSDAQLKRWCEQRSVSPHTLSALLLPTRAAQGLMKALSALNAPFVSLSFTPSVAEARVSFHMGALDYLSVPELLSHGGLIEQLLNAHAALNRPLTYPLNAPSSHLTPPSHKQASDLLASDHLHAELTPNAQHHRVSPQPKSPADQEELMLSLIDESRPFQEALTPLEDELRRLYLSRTLKREGSIASAARHAGLDRANFKRLLKRYKVE